MTLLASALTRRYGAARERRRTLASSLYETPVPLGGISLLLKNRAARLAAACMLPVLVAGTAEGQTGASRPPPSRSAEPSRGGVIGAIRVEGNQRIETGTILSYLLVQPGDQFNQDRLDRSLKTLYA